MPMMRIILSGSSADGERQFKRLGYYGPDSDTCTIMQNVYAELLNYLAIRGLLSAVLVDTQAVNPGRWDRALKEAMLEGLSEQDDALAEELGKDA